MSTPSQCWLGSRRPISMCAWRRCRLRLRPFRWECRLTCWSAARISPRPNARWLIENAQVGIARTAFYPHITLSGSGGWQSSDIASLLNAPSLFWSLGADALQPIFEGGRNRANLAAARAAYDQSVANYRQSVLTAFQQVEDGISNLSTLSQALTTQHAAVEDARRALAIANNRYIGGATNYLDVITAQTTLLTSQRLETQLLGQQMVSSVYLVKALGGGWDAQRN